MSDGRSLYCADLHRTVLAPRLSRGLRDAQRLERVAGGAEVLGLPAREAQEVRELGPVGVGEAHEEGRIRGARERRRVGLGRPPGRPRIDTDRERVLRAVDLDVDVVARLVAAERGHDPERAATHLREHRARANVAELLVGRETLRGTGRGDLVDLVREEPACYVEVVDELVL